MGFPLTLILKKVHYVMSSECREANVTGHGIDTADLAVIQDLRDAHYDSRGKFKPPDWPWLDVFAIKYGHSNGEWHIESDCRRK